MTKIKASYRGKISTKQYENEDIGYEIEQDIAEGQDYTKALESLNKQCYELFLEQKENVEKRLEEEKYNSLKNALADDKNKFDALPPYIKQEFARLVYKYCASKKWHLTKIEKGLFELFKVPESKVIDDGDSILD